MILDIDEFLHAITCCTMKGKWGNKSAVLSSQITCKVEDNKMYLLSANRANSVAVAYQLILDNAEDANFVLDLEVLPMLKTFSGEVEFEVGNVLTILQGSDTATIPLVAHHENEVAIDRFSSNLIEWIENDFTDDFEFGNTLYDLGLSIESNSLKGAISACNTVGSSNYVLNYHQNNRLYLQSTKGQRKISKELEMIEHFGNPATVPFAAPIDKLFQTKNDWDNTINMKIHDDMPLFARTSFAAIIVAPYMS
tara:strand:- start:542 stop:1297 length:756 start_codon:yes stop_codon:yes gene_type:complete